MRIGINGRFLVAQKTGVQRAAYNLIKTLIHIDHDNEYIIFTSDEQLDNADWKLPHVKVVGSALKYGENFRNHIWEQFYLPKLARLNGIDILYSPANMAPLLYKGKSVIFVHDLCFVVNPQWYSFAFRTLYNFLLPKLTRKADKIITNSNNSKNDLLQYFGSNVDKIRVAYLAVDDIFSLEHQEEDASKGDSKVFDRRLLDSPFVLYVGSLEPRKNLKTLLYAYEKLRDRRPDLKLKLVLIGCENPLFARTGLRIERYKDDIVFMGFVADEALRVYYQAARLVAYPSIYEGFGLPPLEAMSSGTPVITSTTSSLPEVVGDAAIKIDPFDGEALSVAMEGILTNPELAEQMRRLGLEQAAKFNWVKVAYETLEAFYEIYDEGAPMLSENGTLQVDRWRELHKNYALLAGNKV